MKATAAIALRSAIRPRYRIIEFRKSNVMQAEVRKALFSGLFQRGFGYITYATLNNSASPTLIGEKGRV